MAASRSSRRSRVSNRNKAVKEGNIAQKVVIVSIIIIAVLSGTVIISRMNPPEKKAAAALIEEADVYCRNAAVGGDLSQINAVYAKLNEYKARLEAIPADFKQEKAAAAGIIAKIDQTRNALSRHSLTIDAQNRARADLKALTDGIKDGSLDERKALITLRRIQREYPGDEAVAEAQSLYNELQSAVENNEQTAVKAAHTEALAAAGKHDFKKAESIIESCLNGKYLVFSAEAVDSAMQKSVDDVLVIASEWFNAEAAEALTMARDGKKDAALQHVRQIYEKIGFPELEPELKRTQQQINEY